MSLVVDMHETDKIPPCNCRYCTLPLLVNVSKEFPLAPHPTFHPFCDLLKFVLNDGIQVSELISNHNITNFYLFQFIT